MTKEFEFFVKADLSKYEGKYIAIVEDKVVAYGDNAREVWEEAKKKTGKIPTIAKIPKEEALILINKINLLKEKNLGFSSIMKTKSLF